MFVKDLKIPALRRLWHLSLNILKINNEMFINRLLNPCDPVSFYRSVSPKHLPLESSHIHSVRHTVIPLTTNTVAYQELFCPNVITWLLETYADINFIYIDYLPPTFGLHFRRPWTRWRNCIWDIFEGKVLISWHPNLEARKATIQPLWAAMNGASFRNTYLAYRRRLQ